ncbi:Exonuclease RNase T and DNA polymerase III [Truepera radiovictrix DSM 17093]|uniref:Exonuclease RNase T and DNA polymerase III n=1 Tax=Truepera radiovictrix (strain DSM 17093 / CIP 108686 / LMG 22925 / RQ-24) TaxID=649638 RepID=D7CXP0_TRURR|nr:Exonuclease RNase T and DNA polymerase III [Truepera radiovictrix DSM 17093]
MAAIAALLARDDVLILDTETTGLKSAEVIELALLSTRGEVLLDTLVRPKVMRLNPYAARVHRITLAELADRPTWPEVLPELRRLAERATVLAWNAPFDARMLEATSAAWGLPHPRLLFACAMRLYARARGRRSYGLHRALADEGLSELLECYASHRARGDVQFVLEVLRAALRTPQR